MEQSDSGDISPAESLALIEQQQGHVERTLEPNVVVLYGTWGAAWFLGFAVLYLAHRGAMPLVVGWLVFAGLQLAAIVVTGVHIARATRGVRGVSSEVGAMYGWG
ncbi:MAG: hypothetical protein ACR2FQ_11695, partial [Pseudonocardiaceae bacterium]